MLEVGRYGLSRARHRDRSRQTEERRAVPHPPERHLRGPEAREPTPEEGVVGKGALRHARDDIISSKRLGGAREKSGALLAGQGARVAAGLLVVLLVVVLGLPEGADGLNLRRDGALVVLLLLGHRGARGRVLLGGEREDGAPVLVAVVGSWESQNVRRSVV